MVHFLELIDDIFDTLGIGLPSSQKIAKDVTLDGWKRVWEIV